MDGFVVVFRPADEPTANIVKSALEDVGIEVVVRRYESAMFDGIFTNAEGAWGEVLVPEKDAKKAMEVLQESTSGNHDSDEEADA